MSNIFVIGDVMLDRYIQCDCNRISPEAPIPVLIPKSEECKLGGAANVALNISKLENSVTLLGAIGDDKYGSIITSLLNSEKIKIINLDRRVKTTLKTRFVSGNQQVLRVDDEEKIENKLTENIKEKITDALKVADLIVISDYNKGVIDENIMELVRNASVRFIVDPKKNNWDLYAGAYAICPNLKELEIAYGAEVTNIELATSELRKTYGINNIIATLSEDGIFLAKEDNSFQNFSTTPLSVVDVTGAGDTVISVVADGIVRVNDISRSVRIANEVARISVQTLGTYTIPSRQVVENSSSVTVFTNGCFDVIHAGHVDYLKKARSYGSRLIVGLNSDASVKKIKGIDRPINSVEERKLVLEGLGCVDEVIVFNEETPENLIKQINPDILVKGGDWKNKLISGSDHVLKTGGKIVFIDFNYHTSSTKIINQL